MSRNAGTPRGFTLIEMVVGLTVSLLVFTAASEAMYRIDVYRRRAAIRAELIRDGQTAMDWLRRDLAAAGVGAESGGLRASVANTYLVPSLMPLDNAARGTLGSVTGTFSVGGTGLVILADVARPDTNFDGVSTVNEASPAVPANTDIAPLNEISGRCHSDNTTCGGTPRLGARNPSADCTAGTSLACPWGLGKYVQGQPLQILDGDGNWTGVTISALTPGTPNYIRTGTNISGITVTDPRPVGRVVQYDTIGYRVVTINTVNVLQRRQCWKNPTPEANGTTFSGCTTGTNDTGWLPVARNVDAAATTVTFFQTNGTSTTTTDTAVGSVQINLQLAKKLRVGSQTQSQTITERFQERMILRSL
ncbi:MAG: prepilin-type N-terminal cleavage/methylation domain-containing protein [Myxococcota bacterium]